MRSSVQRNHENDEKVDKQTTPVRNYIMFTRQIKGNLFSLAVLNLIMFISFTSVANESKKALSESDINMIKSAGLEKEYLKWQKNSNGATFNEHLHLLSKSENVKRQNLIVFGAVPAFAVGTILLMPAILAPKEKEVCETIKPEGHGGMVLCDMEKSNIGIAFLISSIVVYTAGIVLAIVGIKKSQKVKRIKKYFKTIYSNQLQLSDFSKNQLGVQWSFKF